jgi:hypothetical protein
MNPIQPRFIHFVLPILVVLVTGCAELEPYREKVEPIEEELKQQVEPVIEKAKSTIKQYTGDTGPEISTGQMVSAIKQALSQGVDDSVYLLGSLQGFNLSEKYHIPLPDRLEKPAELLRKLGQGKKVDDIETRLNRAAQQAVKQATPVFTDAISSMSVTDALGIMQGADDAATQYFRDRTETSLRTRFLPIISKATGQTGLTNAYKSLNNTMNTLMSDYNTYTVDIDRYVLNHAMDALFDRIAIEEKLIREQPVKRTTELMRKVYGYFEKS